MAEQQHVVLSADEIFSAKDNETLAFVECPEWGTTEVEVPAEPNAVDQTPQKVKKPKGVFVRGLTLKERGVVRKFATERVADPDNPGEKIDAMNGEKLEAMMVVSAAVNAEGRPIFQKTDWEGLMDRLGGPVGRVARKALELSGLLLNERKIKG